MNLILRLLIFVSILIPSFSLAEVISEENKVSGNHFSKHQYALGLSTGIRFNIAEEIFTNSDDNKNYPKDHFFNEIEVFGNNFFSNKIKHNYGLRINNGYEIYGTRIFISGGYIQSILNYRNIYNKKTKTNTKWSPFFGFGVGYDLTKNISIKINSMFYKIDYKAKNFDNLNQKFKFMSYNIGLSYYF